MEQTSLSLLDRLSAAADTGAWERFERLYRPWLSGWLRGCGLQPADVDDVVQDVLAVLVREVSAFRHNGQQGAFRKWLRGIVLNRVRGLERRMTRNSAEINDWLQRYSVDDSELTARWNREHDLHVVRKLLEQVAGDFEPKTWQIFQAFVIDDQPATVVATKLGVSEASVWAAKSRVLKRLRAEALGFLE